MKHSPGGHSFSPDYPSANIPGRRVFRHKALAGIHFLLTVAVIGGYTMVVIGHKALAVGQDKTSSKEF